jgi:hypothetical protein
MQGGERLPVEDILRIRMLKHSYCALADECASPTPGDAARKLAALFVEDGVWTADPEYGGHHVGRAAIEQLFSGLAQVFPYGAHMATNDHITVNGDAAIGHWKSIVPCTWIIEGKAAACWIFGSYTDDYAKVGGEWKIQIMRSIVQQSCRHDAGWVSGDRS